MCSPIGIAFERDRRYGNDGSLGKSRLQVVIFRLALGDADPPPVIMDRDSDVVRVVERYLAAIECGVIEVPLRGCQLPDELGEIVKVFRIASHTILGCEVILDTRTRIRILGGYGALLAAGLPIR